MGYQLSSWLFNFVILVEDVPGAAGTDEGLHERSFGLNGVHEVVRGPVVQQLGQGDSAQPGMLQGALQVVVLDAFK